MPSEAPTPTMVRLRQLDEPLRIHVPCRTTNEYDEWDRHWITVHRDWSITTPHDLAAERVAAHLGSRCSCLMLDASMESARWGLLRALRHERAPIRRVEVGWELSEGSAAMRTYPSLVSAAQAARSSDHLAQAFGGDAELVYWILRRLIECFRRATAILPKPPRRDLVLSTEDLQYLWDIGIHPCDVEELAARAGYVEGPVPVGSLIEIVYGSDLASGPTTGPGSKEIP